MDEDTNMNMALERLLGTSGVENGKGIHISDGPKKSLLNDPDVPEGWVRKVVQRKTGATAGKYDVYIFSPEGRKFRSRNELRAFLAKETMHLDVNQFNFSVCRKQSLLKTETSESICASLHEDLQGKLPKQEIKIKVSGEEEMKNRELEHINHCEEFKHKRDESVLCSNIEAFPSKPVKFLRWTPPRSPYNLIQETLYHDPWQLLIATIFLNRTSAKVAVTLIWTFFAMWPTPEAVLSADISEIALLMQPLGLHWKRASLIKRFSNEFISKKWIYPRELHGIGKYGDDSYRIFCVNEWKMVKPTDSMLRLYLHWLWDNYKLLGLN